MKESNFQFSNPSLTYIDFKENIDFTIEKDKEIEIGTNINVSHTKINDTEATVGIRINVGSNTNSSPFILETEFVANFRWEQEIEQDKVELFLNQNAPALVLSYARPIIAMVTNASHFPAYNIPFVNFTEKSNANG